MNKHKQSIKEKLPTIDEIHPHNFMEGKYVREHFFGKTVKEATKDLIQYDSLYAEDFMYMYPIAFNFYLPCIYNYLSNTEETFSSYPWTWCISTIKMRLEYDLVMELKPSYPEISKISNYILENYHQIAKNHNQYSNQSLFELEFQKKYKPEILFILNKINESTIS